MGKRVNSQLQKYVIYSVYVRNHTPEGSFRALIPDLPRIRSLGVDAIWLMPIHPIGTVARKGTLGSPYANRDYRSINPEYGTLDDFRMLVDAIHEQGMKCLIDVVYNHTSPDSVLWHEHPEWFYRRADGTPGNHVGDWTDIIDLDYSSNPKLWSYQIDSLVEWARIVDGFRCDVASFLPVAFWKQAREACEKVRPGCIWLAETVHRSFGSKMRASGLYCASDTEAFAAFDIEYAYDVQEVFDGWLEGRTPLSHYLDLLDFQESAYPCGFNKLRFLENHDTARIASRLGRGLSLEALTAFLFFLKGATLVYAGQESAAEHTPSLFDRDPIVWGQDFKLSSLLTRLAELKHTYFGTDDYFTAEADDARDIAILKRNGTHKLLGAFPLAGKGAELSLDIESGTYENLIYGEKIVVREGKLLLHDKPVIIERKS